MTTEETAYKLWQSRVSRGIQTTANQNWQDALRVINKEHGYQELLNEITLLELKSSNIITT